MAEARIPGGYIILSRKIIESEIMNKPPLYMKVWIYLLARAQHSQYNQLQRGQLRTSIQEIQEACSWYVGFRKVTPTKREIQNILDWMRGKSRKPDEQSKAVTTNSPMISTTKVTHGMIVTIENYDVYQTPANYERYNESSNERTDEEPLNSQATLQYKQECFKNDLEDEDDSGQPPDEPFNLDDIQPDERIEEIKRHFGKKAEKIWFSPKEDKAMTDLLEAGIPVETIKEGIDLAFKRFKPNYEGDRIQSFIYCLGTIYELHEAKTNPKPMTRGGRNASGKVRSGGNQAPDPGYEEGTGYFEQYPWLFHQQ